MDDAMCLPSKHTRVDESTCHNLLLDSRDSKCVCARGNQEIAGGITPFKEIHGDRKDKQRGEGKSSKSTTTPRINRNYERKEKTVEYSFHHYQDFSMYSLQYRKEHTQGSSESEEKFVLGYNVPDPYLPTTLNASVLEERMRLIEAISDYYHKQSNLHRACVNLTGTERKSARQEKSSDSSKLNTELPQINSANAKKSSSNTTSSSSGNSHPGTQLSSQMGAGVLQRENSFTSEAVVLKKPGLDSPRFHWMESIAKGEFNEVGPSYYRNPKRDIELDAIANSRRYLLTQPSGLNSSNLYVGNTLMPFKPTPTNVSKCEIFSSTEVSKTQRVDSKKARSGNSIIAVIGHSTGDFKPDVGNKWKKKEKKGDNFGYYSRFDNCKTNSDAITLSKVQSRQGHTWSDR